MPFPMSLPPLAPMTVTQTAPRIAKVRVGYQSLVTKSAYPVNQENIRLLLLVWVEGQKLPYSSDDIKNDGATPVWMTGSEGLGISGAKMVYTERGEKGDGRDAQGRYVPERLPVQTWQMVGGANLPGFARVQKWPSFWANPTVIWFRIRHKIASEATGNGTGKRRTFQMSREKMPDWQNRLGVTTLLERGVHRYVAEVTLGGQKLSSVDAPPRTWFSDSAFADAFATRIAVRDSVATGDPFLQYASLFLGTPYSYGGYGYGGASGNDGGLSGVHGMDCSGLVTAAFFHARYKYELQIRKGGRTSTAVMANGGGTVPTVAQNKANLKPGDLMNYAGSHVRIVWQYTPGRDTYFGIEAAPPEVHIHSFPVFDSKYKARHLPLRDTDDYKRKAVISVLETIIGAPGFTPPAPPIVTPPRPPQSDSPGSSPPGPALPHSPIPKTEYDTRIFVDGAPLTLPFAPVEKGGAVQVAQRPILESAGFRVGWFSTGAGANAKTGLQATRGTGQIKQTVLLTVKSKSAIVNGKSVTLFLPPYWDEKQVVASTAIFKRWGWTVTTVGRKLYIRTR